MSDLPPSEHRTPKPGRRSRAGGKLKQPPKVVGAMHRRKPARPMDESVFIEAAELDSVFHDVDKLGAGTDRVTFGQGGRMELNSELDMTPMVDVTFLLLIFFMVTAAFTLQRSLEVPTPRPEQPSQNVQQRDPREDPDLVTVQVDRFNTYRVITTDWDVEAPSVPEMLIKLREAAQGNRQGHQPTRLLVMASREALHESVIAALDGGKGVNMARIQLLMMDDEG